MSTISVVDFYCQLCRENDQRIIVELQSLLERDPSVLDFSLIYLPQKHFKCIVELISIRPEIECVLFSNCSIQSNDLTLLFESIREKRIVSLSLKNVSMSAVNGEELKELCKINPHIVSIDIEGTMLPDHLVEKIVLAVELNRALRDDKRRESVLDINRVKNNIYYKIYYWPCFELERKHFSAVQMTNHSLSQIMKEALQTEDGRYVDYTFNYESKWFEDLYANFKWVRGFSIVDTNDTVCIGNSAVLMPEHWMNENLWNALNLLLTDSNFVRSIFIQDLKDVSCFRFQFFVQGAPVQVVVDDYLPVIEREAKFSMVGLYSNSNDFFASLVEKAIAKLFGGYSALTRFSLIDYIVLLTGGLCFFKKSKDVISFKMHDIFEAKRQLLLKHKRYFCIAQPESPLESMALAEKGLKPGYPYTVVSTDLCQQDGVTEYLVQIMGPSSMSCFSESYCCDNYKNSEYLGFPLFWMRFENFFVYFNKIFFVLWKYTEHKGYLWRCSQEKDAVVQWDVTSPQFPQNSVFKLECVDTSSISLFVYIESNEMNAGIRKQLHFFSMRDDNRRYDISKKNEVNCSEKITDMNGGVLVYLMPGERLQVVPSAEFPCSYTIKAVSLGSFVFSSFPSSRHCYYLEGKWDFFREGIRIADALHTLKNVSSVDQQTFLFSLSQELTEHGPFGVSLLIWSTSTPEKVNVFQNSDVETEIITEEPAVFQVKILVNRGSSLVVVPCRHDRKCPSNFRLSIFSEGKLSLDSRPTTAPFLLSGSC